MNTDWSITYEPVPLHALKVDSEVQRELKNGNPALRAVRRGTFDIRNIGAFTVSERGGVKRIMDGQHRFTALHLAGYPDTTEVMCEIHRGLSLDQEAELFLRKNDSLKVAALDEYKAAVIAGRPAEVAVQGVVEGCGFRVAANRIADRPTIRAIGALMKIHRRDGDEVLDKALRVGHEAWGDEGLDGDLLDALALVLSRNPHVRHAELVKALRRPKLGLTAMRQLSAKFLATTGDSTTVCHAAAICDLYNVRRREAERIEIRFTF